LVPPNTSPLESVAHQLAPWDTLEQFLRELASSERSVQQIRLALDAVHKTVAADAVYCCSEAPEDGVEMVGNQELPPDWCRQFVRRLLAETPGVDGQLLRSSLPPGPHRALPSPRSAAMVRLSKSRSSWIVALSFRPEHHFTVTDIKVMSLARRMVLNQRKHAEVCGKMKETVSSLANCLTAVIDSRVAYLTGHSERVAQLAARLAQQLRLPIELISDSYFSGLLHDIGTVNLPEDLLLKPSRLTERELAQIKECPLVGDRILARVKHLGRLRPAIRHHHERYDGSGYPDRLAGEEIPLVARVLSVAESCDAMLSARPYRPALPPRKVEAILADGAGRQWDPFVVEQFLNCRTDIYALCEKGAGLSVGPAVERAVEVWNADSFPGAGLPQAEATVTAECRETVRARPE
jgi:HD-GYP domain-containing protein (c-di-GMP phosphodiesterase class II)